MLELIFLVFTSFGWAQSDVEFSEKVIEGKSNKANMSQARQEILTTSLEQAIYPLIRSMVGDAAFNKNKNLIQTKIIKNYGRFVPTLRTSDLKSKDDGFTQTITLKISKSDLAGVLSENGLMQDLAGVATILPFVKIEDRLKGQRYVWWLTSQNQNNNEAEKMAKLVEEKLSEVFFKNNFLSFRPIHNEWSGFSPSEMQTENPRKSELAKFTAERGGQIALSGEILMQEVEKDLQLQVRMEAFHVLTARTVGEVVRTLKFENKGKGVDLSKVSLGLQEAISDLSLQVFEASQKGTLSAESFLLVLVGKMTIPQIEALKEQIKSQVPEVKSIKERRLSFDEKVFEVESSEKIEVLAEKLKKFNGPGLKLSAPQVVTDKNEIRMTLTM